MSKKIKVKYSYRDLELGRLVKEGEELIVSDDRAEVLLKKGFIRIAEDVIKDVVEEKEEKLEVKTKELKTSKKTK